MRHKKAETYHPDHDDNVGEWKGKYSLDANRALQLGDTNSLLDEASDLIFEYMQFSGFGGHYAKLRDWQEKLKQYAEKQKQSYLEGTDWK